MDYRLTFAFLAIVACYLGVVLCEEGKACNPQDLRESSCGANETCHLDGPPGASDGFLRGRCRCRKDFSRASRALDAPCVPRKPSTPPASPAAGSDDDVGGGGGGGGGGPAAARRSDDTSSDADDPGPAAGGGDTPAQGSGVSTGAVTAAVLVPLIVAVGALLVIGARRYRWTERVRRLRGSRYEEVRIGQEEDDDDDDPPLA